MFSDQRHSGTRVLVCLLQRSRGNSSYKGTTPVQTDPERRSNASEGYNQNGNTNNFFAINIKAGGSATGKLCLGDSTLLAESSVSSFGMTNTRAEKICRP